MPSRWSQLPSTSELHGDPHRKGSGGPGGRGPQAVARPPGQRNCCSVARPSPPRSRPSPIACWAVREGHGENDFKIGLARRAIVRALAQAANATPQSQTDKRIA